MFIFLNCTSKKQNEKDYPELKNVSSLKSTDFLITFENRFNIDENSIYSASLPIAWNEVKEEIGNNITQITNNDLKSLNNTKSYMNSLQKDDYRTSTEVLGDFVKVEAYFNKSLDFVKPFTKFEDVFKFKNTDVESFGFIGINKAAKINYYNSETDFSISLLPKNKEHEIILIMYQEHKSDFYNLSDYYERYKFQKRLVKNKELLFLNEDKVQIPIIQFNLEKSFDNIIGSEFMSNSEWYEVIEMYQKNAFKLNEEGAKLESKSEIKVAKCAVEVENPKLFIFNKPFVVLLKQKQSKYPYFGVYIANDELLKKKL